MGESQRSMKKDLVSGDELKGSIVSGCVGAGGDSLALELVRDNSLELLQESGTFELVSIKRDLVLDFRRSPFEVEVIFSINPPMKEVLCSLLFASSAGLPLRGEGGGEGSEDVLWPVV